MGLVSPLSKHYILKNIKYLSVFRAESPRLHDWHDQATGSQMISAGFAK